MPGRKFNNGNYRYGFNGMEYDPKLSNGNYTTHFRALDTRIGRWWSVDPITRPNMSPYNSMDNNPIILTDPEGDCPICPILYAMGVEATAQTTVDAGLGLVLAYLTGEPYGLWALSADFATNLIPWWGEFRTGQKFKKVASAMKDVGTRLGKIPGAKGIIAKTGKLLEEFKNNPSVDIIEKGFGYLYEFKVLNKYGSSGELLSAGLTSNQMFKGGVLKNFSSRVQGVFKKHINQEFDIIEDLGEKGFKFVEAKTSKAFKGARSIADLGEDGRKLVDNHLTFLSDYLKAGGKGKWELATPYNLSKSLKNELIEKAKEKGIDSSKISFKRIK